MRVTEKKRHTERSSIHWFPSRWLQQSNWAKLKSAAMSFFQVSHVCGRVPDTWAILYYFMQAASQDLDQKWSSRDMDQHLHGMLALQLVALLLIFDSINTCTYKQYHAFIDPNLRLIFRTVSCAKEICHISQYLSYLSKKCLLQKYIMCVNVRLSAACK